MCGSDGSFQVRIVLDKPVAVVLTAPALRLRGAGGRKPKSSGKQSLVCLNVFRYVAVHAYVS